MGIPDLAFPLLASSAVAATVGIALYALYARCYLAVPPNRALVLYGRRAPARRRDLVGRAEGIEVRSPRVVVGGGAFVAPWEKGVGHLSLDPVAVDVPVRTVHALEGIHATGWEARLAIEAKIPAEPALLATAAENLLGRSEDEVRAIVRRAVEDVVPGLLARLGPGDGEPDWDHLAAEVEASVAADLVGWGLIVRRLSFTQLHRILPAEPASASGPAKTVPVLPSTPGPRELAAAVGRLEARLVRAERSLGLVGAEVLRLRQEAPGAFDGIPRPSVLDLPLGYGIPVDLGGTEGTFVSDHDSMGGEPSLRPRPAPIGAGPGEGGRGPRPLLD